MKFIDIPRTITLLSIFSCVIALTACSNEDAAEPATQQAASEQPVPQPEAVPEPEPEPAAELPEVIVVEGRDEFIPWMESENWWGEINREEQLTVPHVIITAINPSWKEYSANLPAELLDLQTLMAKMHTTAAETGIFPQSGMRSRAIRCDEFYLADGDPAKGFLNLSMKIGSGRDLATRKECGELLFATLVEHLQPLLDRMPLAISFEMRELHEHVKFNRKSY